MLVSKCCKSLMTACNFGYNCDKCGKPCLTLFVISEDFIDIKNDELCSTID